MLGFDINFSKLLVDTLTAIASIFILSNMFYFLLIISAYKVLKRGSRLRLKTKVIESPISLIVPAFNEEKNILASMRSFLNQKYSKFEIIVVNDGSKDSTLDKILKEYNLIEIDSSSLKFSLTKSKIKKVYKNELLNLTLIDKENGGKADALNAGIDVSQYSLVCCVDADSLLREDAFSRIGQEFALDPELIACGASVRIANGRKILDGKIVKESLPTGYVELCQDLEYTRSFLMGRVGWELFQSTMIISGALGIFKKEALLEINGFDHRSIGEDMDLVVRMHKHYLEKKKKYKIGFIPDPLCWTEVPANFNDLAIQRNRWQRGLLSSILRGDKLLVQAENESVFSKLSIPYYLITEIISPIIEILSYALILIGVLFGFLDYKIIILFYSISVLFSIILSLVSVMYEETSFSKKITHSDLIEILVGSFLENFGYRQFMAYQRLKGVIDYYRNKEGWGKIERYGFEKKN